MEPPVADNAAEHRYELSVGGAVAGFVTYHDHDGRRVLVHTEVEPEYEGRGLGAQLVGAVLEDVRRRGLKVTPLCPFAAAYVRRHPEEADLVA